MTEITFARPEDIDRCRTIITAAFAPYIRALGRSEPPLASDNLPSALAERRVLVAQQGGQVVGLALFSDDPPVRSIDSVAVHPDYQGQGIGSGLLRAVEARALRQGVAALELCTAEKLTDRVRLYEHHGFRVIRRALPPHGRDRHMRVFMRKELGGA